MNSVALNNWLNRYQKSCRRIGESFCVAFILLDGREFEVFGQSVVKCVRLAIQKQIEEAGEITEIPGVRYYDENMGGWMFALSPEFLTSDSEIEEWVATLNKTKLEVLLYGGSCWFK